MCEKNRILEEDLAYAESCSFIPWDELEQKTVLITGGTGLIGRTLAKALINHKNIRVLLLVRNIPKAEKFYPDCTAGGAAPEFIQGTIEDLPEIPDPIDYIIHCAAPTASSFFVEHSAETIKSIVSGTENLLELARQKKIRGMVVLSSMEVFGEIHDEEPKDESAVGYLDPLKLRSSYPEAKRLMETLCCAWAGEYGVPVTTARLAQTFGPGVMKNDQRIFAWMTNCALNGEDIRLKTSGSKKNPYLYTMDAVTAILLLLCRGARGETYNTANPATYCSIKEMAEMVADTIGEGKICVYTNCGGDTSVYRPEGCLNLDVSKLLNLGWSPRYDLPEMYRRLAAGMEDCS